MIWRKIMIGATILVTGRAPDSAEYAEAPSGILAVSRHGFDIFFFFFLISHTSASIGANGTAKSCLIIRGTASPFFLQSESSQTGHSLRDPTLFYYYYYYVTMSFRTHRSQPKGTANAAL